MAPREWRVLHCVAVGDQAEAVAALAAPAPHWPSLLSGATGHRLLPALSVVLRSLEIDPPRQYRVLLHAALAANRYRARFLIAEAVQIAHELDSRGVKVAVTKGTAMYHSLYNS